MDLDSVADELYGVSPDDFVARRKDLVAQARQAGDRELAKQVGQLRRPTRTGWLVNVLARAEPVQVEALLALGQALAQAQQRGSGVDLRRLSQERRTAVDALAKRALALARDHGYEPPEAARQEVAQTLQAALGDPGTAELVRRGQLTQALTYGGFGPTDASVAWSAPTVTPEPADAPASPADADAARAAAAEQDRQRRAAAEQAAAQAAWHQARDELTVGEAEAERSTRAADELADRVEQLRGQLHETEEAERAAREAGRVTRKRLAELRRAAAVAEQAVTRLVG